MSITRAYVLEVWGKKVVVFMRVMVGAKKGLLRQGSLTQGEGSVQLTSWTQEWSTVGKAPDKRLINALFYQIAQNKNSKLAQIGPKQAWIEAKSCPKMLTLDILYVCLVL